MPEEAPVTKATFPLNSRACMSWAFAEPKVGGLSTPLAGILVSVNP
jgi:hypothetical protein